jgi:hypothetical protein
LVSVIAEAQGAQDKFTAPHKHCKLRFMVLALPNIFLDTGLATEWFRILE